jgi:FixJ family two-component response regulator
MTAHPLVFVVDDNEGVRVSLRRLLTANGIAAEDFPSPAAFLARAPHDGPACALVDLVMPGMTGIELQRRLADVGHGIPVIFISGAADVPSAVQAMREGAVDFLQKPLDGPTVLSTVRKWLDRDAHARTARAEEQALSAQAARLTARERMALSLIAQGLTNREMGQRMGTTERTAKAYRVRLRTKLNVETTSALVRFAERAGLASTDGVPAGA